VGAINKVVDIAADAGTDAITAARLPGPHGQPNSSASPADRSGHDRLTVPEIARLLTRPPGQARYWRAWRRCHRARARCYHQRTRLARDIAIILAS
jgi:hypothetical protein